EEGALRLLEIGAMARGEIDDPHDGRYDLPELVNVVVNRLPLPDEGMDPMDLLPPAASLDLINQRLRLLLDKAKHAPYYGAKLREVTIETVSDLPRLSILTRSDMEANMPPNSNGLATGEYTGGYVTRSGGSTGEPKFSIYD